MLHQLVFNLLIGGISSPNKVTVYESKKCALLIFDLRKVSITSIVFKKLFFIHKVFTNICSKAFYSSI